MNLADYFAQTRKISQLLSDLQKHLGAPGGLRLRFASWQPVLRERRGTVCVFPGRAEYIEKYFEVVGELRRRGFAVAVLDWRGQGGSSRLTRNPLKGHVNDFAEYEEDKKRRLGADSLIPHRMKYKKFKR